mmetsp:Transcript_17226/g.43001  ORF Transcript_17226/g.43001 Transcript_17226/m.43001 type:complete len:213 (+) Transcript_17226:105-743(+)
MLPKSFLILWDSVSWDSLSNLQLPQLSLHRLLHSKRRFFRTMTSLILAPLKSCRVVRATSKTTVVHSFDARYLPLPHLVPQLRQPIPFLRLLSFASPLWHLPFESLFRIRSMSTKLSTMMWIIRHFLRFVFVFHFPFYLFLATHLNQASLLLCSRHCWRFPRRLWYRLVSRRPPVPTRFLLLRRFPFLSIVSTWLDFLLFLRQLLFLEQERK